MNQAAERIVCPSCGRDVATRLVRGPKVNAGRPIPPIRVPLRHKRPTAMVEALGGPEWCPNGQRSGRPR